METLKMLIEPQFLAVLAAAVALSYLVGEVHGEHPPESPSDPDGNAGGVDRL